MKARIDEFAFILLAGLAFILIFAFFSQTVVSDIIVEPSSINAKLVEGSFKTFIITIKSNSSNVSIDVEGNLKPYLTLDSTSFDVFGEREVRMFFDAKRAGKFTGKLIVKNPYKEFIVPVNIEVVKEEDVERLMTQDIIPLGSFNIILEENTTKTLVEEKLVELITTGFESNYLTLEFSLMPELDRKSLVLELEIEDYNGVAPLIVEFNGETVYDDVPQKTQLQIVLSEDLVNYDNNVIKIYADLPPIPWQQNYYKIKNAKIQAKIIQKPEVMFNFNLSEKQANNFLKLKIEFLARENEVQQLYISLNNQLLYASKPPLVAFSKTFDKDLFGNPLFVRTDNNELKIRLEEPGKLTATNANIYIYYLN